jgi:xylulokinase
MDYLLGIDLGTSSVKAIVITPEGLTKGCGQSSYKIDTPRPGWAEQEPDIWVQSATLAIQEAVEISGICTGDIACMGFSGQMHTTVLLDREAKVIRPAICWSDQRSKVEVDLARNLLGTQKLGDWVQNPLSTGFTLPSLLWVKENEPQTYAQISKVLLPKDYLRYRFSGEISTEYSDASATLLMDVSRKVWHKELLDTFQISPAILPEVSASTEIAGYLTKSSAKALALKQGMPMVYGSGDQAAQAIGNKVISPGITSCTIGTGGQILTTNDRPIYDHALRTHTFCHAVPERWVIMGAMLSAGLSLAWLRDNVLRADSFQVLADAASKIEPSAEGLFFLPYLTGERTPHMDPQAKAAFAGLTLRHTQEHMIRAVMEGVIFSLRESIELIKQLNLPVEQVVASGGAVNHPLWLQLQADIFNLGIRRTKTKEAAALGAALMAGVGIGIYKRIEDACEVAVREDEKSYAPNPQHRELYDRAFKQYQDLYHQLKPWFQQSQFNPS